MLATSAHEGADRERLEVELHPARLDLGQVEDVVDEREQVVGRARDPLQVGSTLSAGPDARASSSSMSLTPMMAFIGVRSSWLMFARNWDLCRLACSSSWNWVAFSTAIAAWAAKVWRRWICRSENGRGAARATPMAPMPRSLRTIGTNSPARNPSARANRRVRSVTFGSVSTSGKCKTPFSRITRPGRFDATRGSG